MDEVDSKLIMNWYKLSQLIDGKQPWQMTQLDFLTYHYTGHINDEAYNKYKTIDGLKSLKIKDYPKLYSSKEFRGRVIEFRKSGDLLEYVKHDSEGNIERDSNGLALYLSKKEMIDKNLPLEDQTIVAFSGETAIGLASNEFGSTGIWVVEEYQGIGIGSYLLEEFRKTMKQESRIGQMTSAGINLTISYHKILVKNALESGKNVPLNVLKDYPELVGKEKDAEYWLHKLKQNINIWEKIPDQFKTNNEIKSVMEETYIDMLQKHPDEHIWISSVIPKEIKDSQKIKKEIEKIKKEIKVLE